MTTFDCADGMQTKSISERQGLQSERFQENRSGLGLTKAEMLTEQETRSDCQLR